MARVSGRNSAKERRRSGTEEIGTLQSITSKEGAALRIHEGKGREGGRDGRRASAYSVLRTALGKTGP